MRILIAAPAWAITILIALPLCLQAQETIEHYSQKLTPDERACADFSKPINILSDQNGKYTLVFSDVAKGVVTKAIDIRENNPFAGLGKKTNDPTKDVFILKNKRFKDIFPDFQPEKDSTFWLPADTTSLHKIRMLYSVDASKNRQYAVLAYTLIADEYVCRTQFIALDSAGSEMNRFSFDNIVCGISISDDGRYVAFNFTDRFEDGEEEQVALSGIKIIDIVSNQLIVNKEIKNHNCGVNIYKSIIWVGTRTYINNNNAQVSKHVYFDLKNKKIYTREFDACCLGKLKLFADGVSVSCITGESFRLSFLSDFIVEDLP